MTAGGRLDKQRAASYSPAGSQIVWRNGENTVFVLKRTRTLVRMINRLSCQLSGWCRICRYVPLQDVVAV